MSDDTPTQRIPGGGDTPTKRIDTGAVQEDLHEEKQKSKGLLIGLVAAGGLLLLAIAVIVFFLLNRGQGEPIVAGTGSPLPSDSASPTPGASETPSQTPTPEPTDDEDPPVNPPAATLQIDSFKVSPSTWTCNTSAPVPVPDPKLSFSWSTSNASHVYFAVGSTNDAESNGMGWDNLPTDGSSSISPAGWSSCSTARAPARPTPSRRRTTAGTR